MTQEGRLALRDRRRPWAVPTRGCVSSRALPPRRHAWPPPAEIFFSIYLGNNISWQRINALFNAEKKIQTAARKQQPTALAMSVVPALYLNIRNLLILTLILGFTSPSCFICLNIYQAFIPRTLSQCLNLLAPTQQSRFVSLTAHGQTQTPDSTACSCCSPDSSNHSTEGHWDFTPPHRGRVSMSCATGQHPR